MGKKTQGKGREKWRSSVSANPAGLRVRKTFLVCLAVRTVFYKREIEQYTQRTVLL